jgi:hypothetical protein
MNASTYVSEKPGSVMSVSAMSIANSIASEYADMYEYRVCGLYAVTSKDSDTGSRTRVLGWKVPYANRYTISEVGGTLHIGQG